MWSIRDMPINLKLLSENNLNSICMKYYFENSFIVDCSSLKTLVVLEQIKFVTWYWRQYQLGYSEETPALFMEYLPITVIKYLVANLLVLVEIEIIVPILHFSYFSKIICLSIEICLFPHLSFLSQRCRYSNKGQGAGFHRRITMGHKHNVQKNIFSG